MLVVRSPLRISLLGGGTDLPEYYRKDFGAVCSIAINKYVYVTINNLSTYFPHRFRIAYSQTELSQDANSIRHPLVREALKLLDIQGGIDINVMADIPAGTGMGSSSTFTVSLLHALHSFQNRLVSKERLAREASEIEIGLLKEPIGKQDQYAASFGGINLFRFHGDERVSVDPLPLSQENKSRLTQSLMLFYLGGNRSASEILKTQNENTAVNRAALDKMRDQAMQAAEILSKGSDFDALGHLLREGWELKKSLAAGITSPQIDNAMNRAISQGALGGKLLGAGGNGFLLVYVPAAAKAAVRQELREFTEVHFEVDEMGSTLLYFSA